VTILVDSDVLIEVFRGKNEAISMRWDALTGTETRILYSPVTAAELWAGARPNEHDRLTLLFDLLECAAIDAVAGRKAGEYVRAFAKSHSVDVPDALIAASAWSHDAAVWTRNRKHYPMPDITFF
jgi:predicted nucleic acid-binding protein